MKFIYSKYKFSTLLLFILVFFFNSKIKAQADVVIVLDNSGSIDDTEWSFMTTSVKSIIDQVLACNPNNRVAVVHYSANDLAGTDNKIYIETNFTNNATTAKSFLRRGGYPTQSGTHSAVMGPFDSYSESMSIVGDALDNVVNINTISPQKTLTKLAANKLVVFHYTDASKTGIGSNLLSLSGANYNVFNTFKTSRNATFVEARANFNLAGYEYLDDDANAACAAISSKGGSYMGPVDTNAGDPEGSGTTPRRFIKSNTFQLSSTDVTTLGNNICSAACINPVITSITPSTQTAPQNGTPTNLSASATGATSYQWYSNTTNSNSGGTIIPAATTSTYTPPTNTLGTSYYYVIATNSCGNTSSSTVSITVNCTNPVISSITPASQSIAQNGTPTNLSVTATGATSYQWYSRTSAGTSGGIAIPSATSATYTPQTTTVGTTYYYVVVNNSCGNTTSPASVSVTVSVSCNAGTTAPVIN